jgi:hypothetical protein
LVLAADRLIRDAGTPGRLRLLLGTLPPRPLALRLRFAAEVAPALFLDGARLSAQAATDHGGRITQAATIHPGPAPTVLGLAGPGELLPEAVEIGP